MTNYSNYIYLFRIYFKKKFDYSFNNYNCRFQTIVDKNGIKNVPESKQFGFENSLKLKIQVLFSGS